jgi:hypothetical protein
MKFRVFWVILPCSQIDIDRRLRGACCLHHQALALPFYALPRPSPCFGHRLASTLALLHLALPRPLPCLTLRRPLPSLACPCIDLRLAFPFFASFLALPCLRTHHARLASPHLANWCAMTHYFCVLDGST